MTEWSSMFRAASRLPAHEVVQARSASPVGAEFGANLTGEHTAHELSDLLTAKQSEIDDVTRHVANLPATQDPAWAQWSTDWARFLADWAAVSSQARADVEAAKQGSAASWLASTFITSAKQPWDFNTLESDYQAVLSVLQPGGLGTSRVVDLYRRYQALPGATPIKLRPAPQPTAPDLRLAWDTGKPVFHVPPIPDVPRVPGPRELLAKVPWWGWALGGTVAVGAGVTFLKNTPVGMVFGLLRGRR